MKLKDKLAKADESFTINQYDNGFMIEVGGRDHNDEWATAKVLVSNVDDLINLIVEATQLPRS